MFTIYIIGFNNNNQTFIIDSAIFLLASEIFRMFVKEIHQRARKKDRQKHKNNPPRKFRFMKKLAKLKIIFKKVVVNKIVFRTIIGLSVNFISKIVTNLNESYLMNRKDDIRCSGRALQALDP